MRKDKFPDWFNQAWPDSRLDAMKAEGDPLADSTVAIIFAKGDRDLVNAVMPALHAPGAWPANTPPELQSYLASSQKLPEWADQATLTRAYEYMTTHGVRYNMVLLFLSLPILNAWKTGGAQTLAMTGQLSQRFARRLSETLRFVRAVIKEQALGPEGEGIRTTQKVRLMHATIRHFARSANSPNGSAYWQKDWGQPINQETLTATMLAFSTLAADGLRKLGVPVSAQEETIRTGRNHRRHGSASATMAERSCRSAAGEAAGVLGPSGPIQAVPHPEQGGSGSRHRHARAHPSWRRQPHKRQCKNDDVIVLSFPNIPGTAGLLCSLQFFLKSTASTPRSRTKTDYAEENWSFL